MEKIEAPVVRVQAGRVEVRRGGITAEGFSAAAETVSMDDRPVPDLLAYLQNETELTRSTLVRILKESGRLAEFFNDPQRFLDRVAAILKHELQRFLVDGIKYDRIPGAGAEAEWEMRRRIKSDTGFIAGNTCTCGRFTASWRLSGNSLMISVM